MVPILAGTAVNGWNTDHWSAIPPKLRSAGSSSSGSRSGFLETSALVHVCLQFHNSPMGHPDLTRRRLAQAGLGAFFRAQDLDRLGIGAAELRVLCAAGGVERISRGLYHLVESEPTEHHTLAAVCARVPEAVLCLLTALRYHELGSQLPREVWFGIARKARVPHVPELPIRVVRFNATQLEYGIDEIRLEGVPARITNPARTVVDCFHPWKLRLVGKDVALEALREALRQRKATPDEIARADEACRTSKSISVIAPYLEVLS